MRQLQNITKGLACAAVLALSANVMATEGGGSSFIPGTEQFMLVTVPPPGVYYMVQAAQYDADEFRDTNGNVRTVPIPGLAKPFRKKIQVIAPRVAWVTDHKVFGGRLIFQAMAPLMRVSGATIARVGTTLRPVSGTKSGLGDINLAASIAHSKSEDLAYGYGLIVTAPTGKYNSNDVANPGRNYWAFRPRFAMTYADPEGFNGDFSATYNFNRRNPDTGFRSGQELHIDYAAGWGFGRGWVAGVSGYAYVQTTDDKSDNPTLRPPLDRGRAFAAGPAIKYDDGYGLVVTAAYQREFKVKNRFAGDVMSVKVVMPF